MLREWSPVIIVLEVRLLALLLFGDDLLCLPRLRYGIVDTLGERETYFLIERGDDKDSSGMESIEVDLIEPRSSQLCASGNFAFLTIRSIST